MSDHDQPSPSSPDKQIGDSHRTNKSSTAVARNTSGLKRGGPGRPKGPNKVTVEARVAASALVDDPVYRAKLTRDLRARKVPPLIEQMLWHYAKGKPKDVIELQGSLDIDAMNQMSDAELYARLEAILRRAQSRQ